MTVSVARAVSACSPVAARKHSFSDEWISPLPLQPPCVFLSADAATSTSSLSLSGPSVGLAFLNRLSQSRPAAGVGTRRGHTPLPLTPPPNGRRSHHPPY
ncbi:hypothetical protein BaRGS_00038954 [Batillaria attramentaria]|uniref:Uncharacterized protein n=1 Tax=Batillaria attramentaria TaxID=370345 RepID=A0ABD0J4Q1_9CAEN